MRRKYHISLCLVLIIGGVYAIRTHEPAYTQLPDASAYDDGVARINLVKYILDNNLSLNWDTNYSIGLIRKENMIISFKPGLSVVLINFHRQQLVDPVVRKGGTLWASASFISLINDVLVNGSYIATQEALDSLEGNAVSSEAGASSDNIYLENKNSAILSLPLLPQNSNKQDSSVPSANNLESSPYTSGKFSRIPTIVIDPGHGGKAPGAVGRFSYKNKDYTIMEKDVVLGVSLLVKNKLQTRYPNINIVMTRDTDQYISLEDRTLVANKHLGDLREGEGMLFVSIHANAALTSKASGYEVWYLPPDYRRNNLVENDFNHSQVYNIINNIREEEITLESYQLAEQVIGGLDTEIGDVSRKRGVKEEEFYVVRNAKMPAILVELGFITNPEEGYMLIQKSYAEKLSLGIVKGLDEYLKLFNRQ